MPQKRVFVDTNIILPAMRIGEWNRITGFFSVETVLTIIDETQRGDVNRTGYVPVDRAHLERTLKKIHNPTVEDQAALREKMLEHKIELDDGERDLLAYIHAHEKPSENILILTMADRAAVRAACQLGWGDCLVSLGKLMAESGAPNASLHKLEEHLRESWLSTVRLNFKLGLNR